MRAASVETKLAVARRRLVRIEDVSAVAAVHWGTFQISKPQQLFGTIPHAPAMRPLTESEPHAVFSKLATYTPATATAAAAAGASVPASQQQREEQYRQHVFRLHRSRVYHVPLAIANLSTNVARAHLAAVGTCLGRFTKAGAFRLHVTALDVVAPHARAKVWVKPQGEMPFLYGGHVLRAHVGRWTEDMVQHQGVIVCSMNDTPLVRRSSTPSKTS